MSAYVWNTAEENLQNVSWRLQNIYETSMKCLWNVTWRLQNIYKMPKTSMMITDHQEISSDDHWRLTISARYEEEYTECCFTQEYKYSEYHYINHQGYTSYHVF